VVRVTAMTSWAIVCGIGLGLGLWSLIAMLPRLSRPRLADRVAPYVIDVSSEARELVERAREHPLPLIGMLIAPLAGALRSALGRFAGGNESVALRLRQAGAGVAVERFRSRQLIGSALALAGGVTLVLMASALRPVPLPAQVVVPGIVAVCTFAGQDWLLTRRARARLKRIADEFPTVVELLTLSLSAGEGILDALRRVSTAGAGELAQEFGRAVADVRIGIPLSDALGDVARGIRLPMLTRCLDAVSSALERGTPLAEVLRAQAADAREDEKRRLLETAGKKEVAMLVPLVFLILPVTVLFAIYPGLFVLQSGF
jgi:Flp pilus assembly protein TadB